MFSNIYALFNISPTTLRRWCRLAHITPHQDPVDYRCRYLDDEQMLTLARQHYRVLIVDTESVLLSTFIKLEARVSKLEKEHQNTP
jgi:hypothetical protein